jgi:hypothetical protein
MKTALLGTLACTSLVIGIVGIILPGLPSTEFILLAVWAADRSSPRMHRCLMNQNLIRAMIQNLKDGKMPRKAKFVSTIMMAISTITLEKHITQISIEAIVASIMIFATIWLWHLPE